MQFKSGAPVRGSEKVVTPLGIVNLFSFGVPKTLLATEVTPLGITNETNCALLNVPVPRLVSWLVLEKGLEVSGVDEKTIFPKV